MYKFKDYCTVLRALRDLIDQHEVALTATQQASLDRNSLIVLTDAAYAASLMEIRTRNADTTNVAARRNRPGQYLSATSTSGQEQG